MLKIEERSDQEKKVKNKEKKNKKLFKNWKCPRRKKN